MADERFSKPARFGGAWFEQFEGDADPATRVQLAHATAHALLSKVREGSEPEVVERIVRLAREDGIDTVVELWSTSRPRTLPGALWRVHLLHTLVTQRADETARHYQVGFEALDTAAPVIAGVAAPASPDEVRELADAILRGLFAGDFALALDRAAAFAIVTAQGAVRYAHDVDAMQPARATELTRFAATLTDISGDLRASAKLWREGSLD